MTPSGEVVGDGVRGCFSGDTNSVAGDGQWEDFTCATPWEDFVRSLEEVLREWKCCDTGASLSLPLLHYDTNTLGQRCVLRLEYQCAKVGLCSK